MRGSLAALILSLVATASPAVSSTATTMSLEVNGPALVQGAEGHVVWGGSLREARLGHDAFEGRLLIDGHVRQLNYTYLIVASDEGTPTGHARKPVPVPSGEWDLGRVKGTLQFDGAGPGGSLRLIPTATVDLEAPADFTLEATRKFEYELRDTDGAQPQTATAGFYPADGGLLRRAGLPGASFDGRVVVSDYLIRSPLGPLDLRTTSQDTSLAGYAATVRTTHALVVDGHIATPPLEDSWWNVITEAALTIDGQLLLQNAHGSGSVNGTPIPSDTQMVEAKGDFSVVADYRHAPSSWQVDGESTFVASNAKTVFGHRFNAVEVAGLAALLATAVAAVARFMAGINIADPIGNETRRRIIRIVSDDPGITLPRIKDQTGLSRASVRHHIRVLTRSKVVASTKVGNSLSYTLNHASFDFRAGTSPRLAGEVLGHFSQPKRRAILEALECRGEMDYHGMAQHWAQTGDRVPSVQVINYHCHKLLRLGLVQRRRDGHRTYWSLAFDRSKLLAHQDRAFLMQGDLDEIVGAVGDSTRTLPEIRDSLGRRAALGHVRGSLAFLEATGHIRQSESGYVRISRKPQATPPGTWATE
jgi:predicted transcriptional regulator